MTTHHTCTVVTTTGQRGNSRRCRQSKGGLGCQQTRVRTSWGVVCHCQNKQIKNTHSFFPSKSVPFFAVFKTHPCWLCTSQYRQPGVSEQLCAQPPAFLMVLCSANLSVLKPLKPWLLQTAITKQSHNKFISAGGVVCDGARAADPLWLHVMPTGETCARPAEHCTHARLTQDPHSRWTHAVARCEA